MRVIWSCGGNRANTMSDLTADLRYRMVLRAEDARSAHSARTQPSAHLGPHPVVGGRFKKVSWISEAAAMIDDPDRLALSPRGDQFPEPLPAIQRETRHCAAIFTARSEPDEPLLTPA